MGSEFRELWLHKRPMDQLASSLYKAEPQILCVLMFLLCVLFAHLLQAPLSWKYSGIHFAKSKRAAIQLRWEKRHSTRRRRPKETRIPLLGSTAHGLQFRELIFFSHGGNQ